MLLRTVLTKSKTGGSADELKKKNIQQNTDYRRHRQVSTSRMQQIVIIDPAQEIKFKGSRDVPNTSYVTLTNPSERGVFFKIKTTAPKKYCVRPNCGLIPPNGNITVAITLQPSSCEPGDIFRHKFMFQTTVAPDDVSDEDIVWDHVSADMIMDSKLRCVYESLEPRAETTKEDLPSEPTDEECRLRVENDLLKQEVKRLSTQGEMLVTSSELRHSFEPPSNAPLPFFAVAVLLALAGILVGKFIL